MHRLKNLLLPLMLLLACQCWGQNNIKGRIIDKKTKKPIAFAVAFLNNSDLATRTTDDGYFSLNNVPAGQYQLLVSIIGYNTYKTSLIVNKSIELNTIELSTKNDTLHAVTIYAKPKLSPFYPAFVNEFLGRTLFARQCKITNPYVIHFYNTSLKGTFNAKSDEFINIDNYALGYRIRFLLNYFVKDAEQDRIYYFGQSYYEEMKGTPAEEKEWKKNRAECYQGSAMQFLRAVLAGRTLQKGFKVIKAYVKPNIFYNPSDETSDRYDIKLTDTILCEEDLLRKTNINGLYALTTVSALRINYRDGDYISANGTKIPRVPWIWQTDHSCMIFEQPYVVFDNNGVITNPASVSFTGYMAEARVANQLPANYKLLQ
jgi:hypothetical protein